MVRLLFAALSVFVLLAPEALADAKADEFQALKSEWTVAKATLGGNNIFESLKVLQFTIHDDGKYTAKLGEMKDEGAFTLDVSATPKSMIIKPTGGPSKDKTLKGIYQLDGNMLTICYDMEGKVTPMKFESTAENKFLLVEYKRKK